MTRLLQRPLIPFLMAGTLGGFLALAGCTAPGGAPSTPADPPAVPGELLIKFQPDLPETVRSTVRRQAGAVRYDELFPGTERWHVMGDATTLRQSLQRETSLAWVELNHRRSLQAFNAAERKGPANQWYLGAERGIAIEAAWATMAGSQPPGTGVMVAVLDTGVDMTHPDLTDRIATTPSTGAKRFIDEFGGSGQDYVGHGTHVAGIVGATAGNGGIVGVAPGATILPVKVMMGAEDGNDFTIAKGFRDAADAGSDVINLSIGGPEPSQTLADVIAYALSKGSTVVIASGNGRGPVYYPAAYAGVLCVGATAGTPGSAFAVPSYSNRGPELSLVAPGGNGTDPDSGIYSTLSGSRYGAQSGTSMATPIVSGVAALVIADAKARGEKLTPSQVRNRLLATARPLGGVAFTPEWGYGVVDPLKALAWSGPAGPLP